VNKAIGFTVSAIGLIGVSWGIFALVYPGAADRRAITISALLALLVQLLGFAIARGVGRAQKNMIAGWGLGAGLRFLALVIYAFVIVGQLGLPPTSSTLSFAVFLFVSTLVEPLFLTA
jgi:hypothetical protein